MRSVPPFGLCISLLAAAALVACSSNEDEGASDASIDGFVVGPGDDASISGDSSVDGATPGVTVRIAQLSADLGAIDLCYRPTGTTSWTGPIFATIHPPGDASIAADAPPVFDADSDDSGGESEAGDDASSVGEAGGGDASAPYDAGPPLGVAFGTMSAAIVLDGSGTFDVAVVESGSVSCTMPLAVDRITLTPAERATLVVMGSVAPDASALDVVQVAAFQDDVRVDPTLARVRFIHAALGSSEASPVPAVRVDLLFADQTSSGVADDLEPDEASTPSSTPPVVDMLGYSSVDSSSMPASVVLSDSDDAAGDGTWTSAAAPLSLTAASIHTALVFNGATARGILYCDDLALGGPSAPCIVLVSE